MAGVKGRSGGPRPGSGRKPKPKVLLDADGTATALPPSAHVGAVAETKPKHAPVAKPKAAPGTKAAPALERAAEKLANTHDLAQGEDDPKVFLERVMGNVAVPLDARMDAAKALMPYRHKKVGEAGKKEAKQEAARKVAGKFAAGAPPRLRAVGDA